MDIFLIILGVLCLLAGLAGCFLPVLPGPPVSYVGLLLLHFTDNPFQYYTFDFMGFFGHYCPGDGLCDAHVGRKIQWRR